MVLVGAAIVLSQTIGLVAPGAPNAMATTTAAHTRSTAAAHPYVTTSKICLLGTTWCANVKNNSNTVGEPVWLWGPAGGDAAWEIVPDPSCVTGLCYFVKDAQNSSLCMAATGTGNSNIELERCNEDGSWYDEGSWILGNAFYGANGNLIAMNAGTGDYLYANRTGTFMKWSAPGIN